MAPEQPPAKKAGRPRVKADLAILLEGRAKRLSLTLIAEYYREETGQFISPSTVRRLILAHQEGERR